MDVATVYDSTTPPAIPKSVEWALGYVDGIDTHNNYHEMRSHLNAQAHIIPVTVTGGDLDAFWCDCEKGDADPHAAAVWARRKHEQHKFPSDDVPVIYYVASNHGQVMNALRKEGADGYTKLAVADYNNQPHIPIGHVAHQYANPPLTGHHYDLSIVEIPYLEHVFQLDAHPLTDPHRLEVKDVREFMLARVAHNQHMGDADRQIVTAMIRACESALAVK